MDIIKKDKNQIFYNPHNTLVPPTMFKGDDSSSNNTKNHPIINEKALVSY